MLKMYSDPLYSSITFTTVLLPMMIFFVFSIVFNILKFLKLLHIEEADEEGGLLSPKQTKLLFTMARNMLGYFGLYMVSGDLEKHVV